MFWADRIAKEIQDNYAGLISAGTPILIRDEKTLSGRVHIGSFRGVIIHGILNEILNEQKTANTFKYEFNDFDPMDGIPAYLNQEEYQKYLGMPLKNIPSPKPGFENFAEYFGAEFKQVIEGAGFMPEFYRSSELYLAGKMDGVIKEALEGAAEVRRIYKEVSGGSREESWLPLSVICPQCGKLSTTRASDFDGDTVQVECRDLEWTHGCHFSGRISPFGGNAKLPWKVEWPAKWKVVGVQVEGAGKDHSTKGGARDVANHVSKDVFNYESPFDVPYEFILIGGKKMSSSKGVGSSAKEISDLLPNKILRLLFLSKDLNQQVNFDPEGDTIPVLYDLYDKLAVAYETVKDDDYARLFELVHPGRQLPPPGTFFPRFSQVAFLVQMPHLDLDKEIAVLKGGELTDADKVELAERAEYAKKWLAEYAPEKFVFTLQDTLPDSATGLSDIQKDALRKLAAFLDAQPEMPTGEAVQHKLHEIKELLAIAPAELFGALYLAFLGKSYGPKIGWFLSVLPKEFVQKRLKEVTA